MSQISLASGFDTRSEWSKISRRKLNKAAKRLGINSKPGEKHVVMVNLYIAAGIKPEQVTEYMPVKVKDANGDEKVVMYPEEKERAYDEQKEHKRMELFEQRIAEATEAENKRMAAEKSELEKKKDSEINILKSELEDMKEMMQRLLESKEVPRETKKGLQDMHWKSFQKAAKEAGIEWTTKDPREPVIAQIEAHNVENTLTGS